MTSRIIGANVIQTGCCGWPVCGAVAWAKIPFKSIKCINSKVVGHFRQINGNGKRFGMCALESAGFGECETDWREEIKLRPDLTQRRKDAATGARTALSARRRQCGRNTRTKLSAPLKSLAAHVDSDVLRCEVAKTSFASLRLGVFALRFILTRRAAADGVDFQTSFSEWTLENHNFNVFFDNPANFSPMMPFSSAVSNLA